MPVLSVVVGNIQSSGLCQQQIKAFVIYFAKATPFLSSA
jgi:hypothetical protein